MPRRPRTDILDDIRAAVVEVVASKGIGATAIADIARIAGVSPGTIYLHFVNKDDLLQQTYLHIKRDFHARMIAAATGPGSAAIIRGMWFSLFDYLRTRPLDFRFLEYAGAAQVLTPEQRAETAPLQGELNALLQAAMDDGTVQPMPITVATSLLMGPAMHIARIASLAEKPPTQAEIDQTFDRVWSCLRN